jgi:iron complex outermembrane receptor protein
VIVDLVLVKKFYGSSRMKKKSHVSTSIGPTLLCAAIRRALLCAGIAGSISAANAQTTAVKTTAGEPDSGGLSEIVVTGTLIRGIAPVGPEVTTLTREDIVSTGVVSTQDLLSTMPQITSAFNQHQNPNSSTGADIVRPSIHNIGAANGNTTLVLFDGHDVVGSGIYQTTPDIGVIPPNVLQSVQVIADGGSALYGADAIGGIVNLITRKHMEGVEVDGHYGWASAYHAEDFNIAGGHEWDGGSFLISYSYRTNNNLTGADRSYFTKNLAPFGGTNNESGAPSTSCALSNVTVGSTSYAVPGLVAGTQNICDTDKVTDVYPSEKQQSFFAAFNQDITSRISFDVTGYYSYRQTDRLQSQLGDLGTITNTNPYFIPVAGATSELVGYGYGSVAVNEQINKINTGGITPELKFQLGGDWDLTTMLNYGRSITQVHSPITNGGGDSAALAGTTIATALDPYNISATSPSVLAPLLDWVQHTQDIQQLFQAKAVAQGTVFSLPGGNVKLAVGAQFERQSILALQANGPLGNDSGVGAGCQYGNCSTASTDNHLLDDAAFGELLLPIVGSGNNFAGVRKLELDLQGRFDRYTLGLGNTANPKFGGTWKPIDDLTFRGTWGTSFTAPSMGDLAGSVDYQAQVWGNDPFGPGGFNSRPVILLAGGGNVKPMTSTTYTAGFDYNPEWLKSTTLSLTYWNTTVKGLINIFPFYAGSYYFNNFPNAYYVNPSLALAEKIIGNEHVAGPSLATLYSNPATTPYAILDAERTNLGNEYINGVDFNLTLKQPTDFGSIYSTLAGTYVLSQQMSAPGSPKVTMLGPGNNISRLLFTAQSGAKVGQFTGGVTFNYSSGYPVYVPGQNKVGAFYPVNLIGAYDFGKWGGMQNLTVTLNLDNVLNMNPVFQNQVGQMQGDGIAANGGTVGRLLNLGVHAKF